MICGNCGHAFSVPSPDGGTFVYNAVTDMWDIVAADPQSPPMTMTHGPEVSCDCCPHMHVHLWQAVGHEVYPVERDFAACRCGAQTDDPSIIATVRRWMASIRRVHAPVSTSLDASGFYVRPTETVRGRISITHPVSGTR